MQGRGVDIHIPVPWGTIAGRTFGEERNIPVLCVHGRCDNLETFSGLVPLLPHNFFFVCIDLPGHGQSSQAEKGYILDLPWYILSVRRVIEHFNWPKMYLLGHSFGGLISFFLAALYPEQVLKLIIIDTLMMFPRPVNIAPALRNYTFDTTLKFEKRLSPDEAPTYSLEDFISKMKEIRLTEVTTDQLRKMAERNLKTVGDNQYKHSNDQRTKILNTPLSFTFEQLENVASEISCPTLLILGKNSLFTNPQSKFSRTPLKKETTTIHVIEGDHDVHIARPQDVANLIVPFLTVETKSKL